MDSPGITVRPLRAPCTVSTSSGGGVLRRRGGARRSDAGNLRRLAIGPTTCCPSGPPVSAAHRLPVHPMDRFRRRPDASDADIGAAYLALHTCDAGRRRPSADSPTAPGWWKPIDKVLGLRRTRSCTTPSRRSVARVLEFDESTWRPEFLYSRSATIYGVLPRSSATSSPAGCLNPGRSEP